MSAQFGISRVTRFYIPLLFQAFSQSISYPLVGSIVTHGRLGVDALTAFAQGQTIMFMIGALGGGLVMTGMVHAVSWSGYRAFKRLNYGMMAVLLLAQCIPFFHPFDVWIFQNLMHLPPHLADVARHTCLYGVVMNGAFFLRNVPMVILFNNLESGKANIATILRIMLTALCALVFPKLGFVGANWGLVALTAGVVLEHLVTWCYARGYVRILSQHDSPRLPWKGGHDDLLAARRRYLLVLEQLSFTLPLSLGSFLLAMSPLAMAIFVGRSTNAAIMLAIHYVTIGVANPVGYAALRMQAVSIAFPPEYKGDRRMPHYAICAGLILGFLQLAFALPGVADWYFGAYQNIPAEHLWDTRLTIMAYSLWPMILALRGWLEGRAATLKVPSAVMLGQAVYITSIVASLAIMLHFDVTGWKMGVSAINISAVATIIAVYVRLKARTGNPGKMVT